MITEMQVVVTSALVILVGLFAFTIGMWVGHGKRDEAEEAELDRAVARHPAGNGKGRHRTDAEPRVGAYGPFPVPEEDIVLLMAPVPAEPELEIPDASVTAWTRAMAADMDQFIHGMVEDSNVNQHLIRARS